MCREFTRLACLVLVLGLAAGVAIADIETGLVGYYPLNEGTGDTTAGVSGNGHDGTLYNGATWILPGLIGNAAMNFDGDPGSRVSVGTWDPGDMLTLAVWARWTGEQNKAPRTGIIGKRDDWSNDGIRWFSEVMTTGQVRMRTFNQTVGSPAGTLTAFIDEWAHIAITFDGSTCRIYLNAEEVASANFSLGPGLTAAMGLGCKGGASNGSTEIFSGDLDDARIYSRALSVTDVKELFGWTGVAGKAYGPEPVDGQTDIPRDVVLNWTAGEFASPLNGHKVYFSENFDDVNDGIGGITQNAGSYALPQHLDFDKTYYWRVDEVNAPPDSTIFTGDVWSFTVEPFASPVEGIVATASSSMSGKGPENTVNGSGLDASGLLHDRDGEAMWLSDLAGPQPSWIEFELDKVQKLHEVWVWNSNDGLEPAIGFGLQDVTIEYSLDGIDYTTLGTTYEFTRAPGLADYAHDTTIDFGGAGARYVRLTANANWGGILAQFGLSEVRFFSIPVQARGPAPVSGATDVALDLDLAWIAGREATTHDVYLSTDEQAVIDGNAPASTVTDTSYSPSPLDLASTYYWRIDEVNGAETSATWQGDIWNFSTPEYLVVDGFEDYNNYPPDEIWNAWIDGYQTPTNGAQVGHDDGVVQAGGDYVEIATVHGGDQSMPLFYSNTGGAISSEAERTFAVAQDWTKYGIQTLVLYFHGTPGSTGQLYAKVNGVRVDYAGDAGDMAEPRWTQWNIDLASLGVNLQGVTRLALGIDGNGAGGTLYIDDIVLYRLAPEVVVPSEEVWIEAEAADSITAPMQTYDDPAALGGKYIGTDESVGDEYDNPPADGVATYTFTVAGGTYKISGRINIPNDNNSFWVRIQGATIPAETELHSSGWVRWNDPPDLDGWFWNDVFSDDDDEDATAFFTIPAGTHVLEIVRREAGAMLDVIVISRID